MRIGLTEFNHEGPKLENHPVVWRIKSVQMITFLRGIESQWLLKSPLIMDLLNNVNNY